MTETEVALKLASIVSPWLAIGGGIAGGIAGFAYKLSPFIKQSIELYAKSVVANEHTAEAMKEIAVNMQQVKQQLPTVCAYPATDRRVNSRG